MDITALSASLSLSNASFGAQVGTALLSKVLDTVEENGDALMQMMAAAATGLGQTIDIMACGGTSKSQRLADREADLRQRKEGGHKDVTAFFFFAAFLWRSALFLCALHLSPGKVLVDPLSPGLPGLHG